MDLRFEQSVEEFIRFLDDLGLSHVEVRQGYLNTSPDPPDLHELRELGETYDFTISIHAPHIDSTPENLNDTLRQATADSINQTLDWAPAAPAAAVVVHAGSARERYPRRVQDRARSQAVRTLRECTPHAADVGVPLCVENQREVPSKRRFSSTSEGLAALLQEIDVDSDYLGVTLDVGHAKASGVDYADFVDRLGDRIVVAHLHDNDGQSDRHDPLPKFESIVSDVGPRTTSSR